MARRGRFWASVAPQVEASIRALQKIRDDVPKRCSEAVNQCADMVLKRAKYYCPVDPDPKSHEELRQSGRVEYAENKGLSSVSAVIFGGVQVGSVYVDYATYVHELTHLVHAPPTGAKFITRAVSELRGSMTNAAGRQLQIGVKPPPPMPEDFGLGGEE